jgi:hypothetical protein
MTDTRTLENITKQGIIMAMNCHLLLLLVTLLLKREGDFTGRNSTRE